MLAGKFAETESLNPRLRMGITYQVDESLGVIFEHWCGTVTTKDLAGHWNARLTDQGTKNYWRTLTDVRECRPAFSTEEYRRLVKNLLEPALSGRKLKIAILVKDELQFGVSRQFQVFLESGCESAIFTEESVAREWLLRPTF